MGDTNAGFRVDPKCEVSRRVTKAMHKNMISLPLIRHKDDGASTAAACVVVSIDARKLATETTSQDRHLRIKVGAGTCGSSNHSAITDDNSTPHAGGVAEVVKLVRLRNETEPQLGAASTAAPAEVDPNKSSPANTLCLGGKPKMGIVKIKNETRITHPPPLT